MNKKIATKTAEREAVKSQLSDYETQRQIKTNIEIEKLKEQISVLEAEIKREKKNGNNGNS